MVVVEVVVVVVVLGHIFMPAVLRSALTPGLGALYPVEAGLRPEAEYAPCPMPGSRLS